MFSYEFYKVAHIVGFSAVFISLGALAGSTGKGNKIWGALHGIGLLVVFVAGFALAGKMGAMKPMAGWIWAKIAIWLIFGGMIALVRRVDLVKKMFWALGPLLVFVAAYLAIYKPF